MAKEEWEKAYSKNRGTLLCDFCASVVRTVGWVERSETHQFQYDFLRALRVLRGEDKGLIEYAEIDHRRSGN